MPLAPAQGADRAEAPVYGREPEIDRGRSLIATVSDGGRAAIVFEGPAGIGKTTLLHVIAEDGVAAGARLLRAHPTEAGRGFGFSGLADLFSAPFAELRHALPGPQARALAAALLLEDADDASTHAVAAGCVTVLAALTESAPVLLVVDDAQWLDQPTARVLTYLARRLPRRCGIVVALRGDGLGELPLELGKALPPDEIARLVLSPLPFAAIHHLVRERAGLSIPRPVLSRLVAQSAGNPYLALEIARLLEHESRAGRLDDPLPIPRTVHEASLGRIRGLSAPARRATLAVAAQGDVTPDLVAAALGGVESARAAIDEATAHGVLMIEGERIRFAHPLLASSVYADAPSAERREMHELLARETVDPETRARHLAAAAFGADAARAGEIEVGAARAAGRGAPDAAAQLYESAASLTPEDDPTALTRRLMGAATALARAGDLNAARDFAVRARTAASEGRAAAEAEVLLAEFDWQAGAAAEATDRAERALEQAAGDAAFRATTYTKLVRFNFSHDIRRALRYAESAVALGTGDSGDLPRALIDQYFAGALAGRPRAPEELAAAVELEERQAVAGGSELQPIPLILFHCLDAFDAARRRFRLEEAWYADRGEELSILDRRSHVAVAELRSGAWERAEELTEAPADAVASYELTGPGAMMLEKRALVDAFRGRTERARSTLEPLVSAYEHASQPWWAALALSTLAFAERSAGDDGAADAALRRMRAYALSVGVRDVLFDRSEPYRIEALVAAGDSAGARRELRRLEHRARLLPRPWIAAALPAARGLLASADGDAASAAAELSHVDDFAAAAPFESAWALLVRGRLQRRAKQKRDAAETLARARERFDSLGAPQWAERAQRELERVGLRRRGAEELTEGERRIAELAASGLTNREVAAQAFVSVKTVEANLARTYRKLGIRSRAQLATRIQSEGRSSQT